MTSTNNHINNDDRVQGLIDLMECSPEDYNHLQIFLSRDGKSNCQPDNKYLMVSPKVFGKVKLLNVNVEDDSVILEILDSHTQQIGNVLIDINDRSPHTFFINWKDIRNMVMEENKIMLHEDDLLEFDYENNIEGQ